MALVEHGCKVIQVDEPVLMRKPQDAIDYGIEDLAACFKGTGWNSKSRFYYIMNILSVNKDDYFVDMQTHSYSLNQF